MPDTNQKPSYEEGSDAVCFTAGTEVAAFGAGTIHAYLATERAAPVVVAGISSGAIVAAVMKRCYAELGKSPERSNSARWAFLRRYLEHLTNRPFEVLWDSLPDSSDFFADHPPISDPATPSALRQQEHEALAQRQRLVQLGRWLVHLPIGVNEVARTAVAYVRAREHYPRWWVLRWSTLLGFSMLLAAKLIARIAISPYFYKEAPVPPDDAHASTSQPAASAAPAAPQRSRRFRRPLFGYPIWLLASAISLFGVATLLLPLALALVCHGYLSLGCFGSCSYPILGAVCPLCTVLLALGVVFVFWRRLSLELFRELRIDKSLIHNYYLRNLLFSLFGDDQVPESSGVGPHPVLVTAPLQTLIDENTQPLVARQLYAKDGTPVVEALLAATAVPGIFKPTDVAPQSDKWSQLESNQSELDAHQPQLLQLVDGAVIRHNPLPAFFSYLRKHPDLAAKLVSSDSPAVHVVYSVPVEARSDRSAISDADANVVDVGLAALRLDRRCDTQLEVLQTNFMSKLYRLAPSPQGFALDVDEVAPDPNVPPLASLGWSASAARKTVAAGCKRTLQVLHQKQLADQPRPCRSFAEGRAGLGPTEKPGLAEVCAECDGLLVAPVSSSSATGQSIDMAAFPQLLRAEPEQPRIVLVASGGVFRGAFHVGMAGALWVAKAKPDLIVGASVGTLMGSVVAAMFQSPTDAEQVPPQLGELVDAFMEVDKRVALTKTLKSAVRELGLRGRSISLSPSDVRRAVKRGSRGDPGFAATGAPPILIDALSDLFIMPREGTAKVARQFINGDVTGAAWEFGALAKAHTLSRFGIENAFMGASLLEGAARRLMGGPNIDLKTRQPYMRRGEGNLATNVAFFATATDLATESLFWLGDDNYLKGSDYDYVEGALASSAFPFVFAPRRASDLYPGNGARERRYSDGGLFDNLPFIPAIQLLADAQVLGARKRALPEVLRDHIECPDLFLVGALDLNPETDPDGRKHFEHILDINKRGGALRKNVKIRGFEVTSAEVDRRLTQLSGTDERPTDADSRFLLSVVNAGVLPIFPSDKQHINGTFAFCASLGFKPAIVADSIANGCFQTLRAFAPERKPKDPVPLAQRAVQKLRELKRIESISWRQAATQNASSAPDGTCPYFARESEPKNITCPFHGSGPNGKQVYERCRADKVHLGVWKLEKPSPG